MSDCARQLAAMQHPLTERIMMSEEEREIEDLTAYVDNLYMYIVELASFTHIGYIPLPFEKFRTLRENK